MRIKSLRHKGQGYIDVLPHADKQEEVKVEDVSIAALLARIEELEKKLEVSENV